MLPTKVDNDINISLLSPCLARASFRLRQTRAHVCSKVAAPTSVSRALSPILLKTGGTLENRRHSEKRGRHHKKPGIYFLCRWNGIPLRLDVPEAPCPRAHGTTAAASDPLVAHRAPAAALP